MEQNRPSVTAMISAFSRAYHAEHAANPIFRDELAGAWFGDAERNMFRTNLAQAYQFFAPDEAVGETDNERALAGFVRVQGGPITLSRSRYVEDTLAQLIEQGVRQYVILGAGLDTFAFRRTDLIERIWVLEVDHPATQRYKRSKLAELGWRVPQNLHFLEVDFAKQDVGAALRYSPYDATLETCFSWLGVTYYLPKPAVRRTLAELAQLACGGSELLFDYLELAAFDPAHAAVRVQRMQAATRQAGEPMQTGFEPEMLARELAEVGWRLVEDLSPAEIQTRYFAGRTDGMRAFEQVHFARAER